MAKDQAKRRDRKRKSGRRVRRRRLSLQNVLILIAVAAVIAVPTILAVVRSATLPGEGVASQGNIHISGVGVAHPDYNSNPPTSGWHVGRLGQRGSFDFAVPDEVLIHNLEDGDVILWYRAGTAVENEAEIENLEPIARRSPRTIIMPREDLDSPYVLTAWQRIQRFEQIDEDGMGAFIDAFAGLDHHGR